MIASLYSHTLTLGSSSPSTSLREERTSYPEVAVTTSFPSLLVIDQSSGRGPSEHVVSHWEPSRDLQMQDDRAQLAAA
jgi:hypothetical protein